MAVLPLIRLQGVHKSFGDLRVLRGLDLAVDEGETVVVLGRSGSGKSVMLQHIVGLLAPDAGHIFYGDIDITTADMPTLRSVRHDVAYLFQTGALVNWMSVRDNVSLPLVEERTIKATEIVERVDAVLDSLGMLEASERLPDEISGGMRKRAALARVLVQEPTVILYDEPTAGLDPVLARTVADLIRNVQQDSNRTAIVVTHDLELAFAVADRIGLHDHGRLVELAPPDEFQASHHPLIRSFLEGKDTPDEETSP